VKGGGGRRGRGGWWRRGGGAAWKDGQLSMGRKGSRAHLSIIDQGRGNSPDWKKRPNPVKGPPYRKN